MSSSVGTQIALSRGLGWGDGGPPRVSLPSLLNKHQVSGTHAPSVVFGERSVSPSRSPDGFTARLVHADEGAASRNRGRLALSAQAYRQHP